MRVAVNKQRGTITYGVKTMNQQRMDKEPAMLERYILRGTAASSATVDATVEAVVEEAPWLASQ